MAVRRILQIENPDDKKILKTRCHPIKTFSPALKQLAADMFETMHAANGVGLAVSEARVRYLSPARFDDLVRIETTLTSVRSRAITFDYLISDAESGTRFATAHTALVSIDTSGRLIAIPAEFRSALETVL